jgi:hypothetical protein
MAPRRARESKQGLVIALVFAVLMVIGLGVTTYFQAQGKAEAIKDRDKAKGDANKLTEAVHYYQTQANLYRAYMGYSEGIDLADLGANKVKLDGGQLGKGETDNEGVTKLIKEKLDPKLLWDPAQNRPKMTYEALLQQEKERSDAAEKNSMEYLAAKDAAQKAAKKADDLLKAERAAFDQKLADLNKKTETDMSKYLETINELRAEITRQGENNDQIRKTSTDEKKKLDDALARAAGKNKELLEQVDVKKQTIEDYINKGKELAPKGYQTDWKIVSISRSSGTSPSPAFMGTVSSASKVEGAQTAARVYINLGSADHVLPQLTFSIHGPGPDGRPLPEAKGSLEVVQVLGDHLSQARVMTVKDRNKEPVLQGDILFNPSWSPTTKKHVALAGTMDLLGNGQDDTYELVRNLERQNVVVDAFIDPRENTAKGKGITVQTDYLIIPDVSPPLSGTDSEREREAAKKREDEIAKLIRQAKENGVQ